MNRLRLGTDIIDVQPDAPYLTWKKGEVDND